MISEKIERSIDTEGRLSIEEEETLRAVYRRDVKFWGWQCWVARYKKFGDGTMTHSWVLWPYKMEPFMPVQRRRMNEIYHECLLEYAYNCYGLGIRLDAASNKLILCAPNETD